MNQLGTDTKKSVATETSGESSISSLLTAAASNGHSLYNSLPYVTKLLLEGIPRYGRHGDQSGPSKRLVISTYFEICQAEDHRLRKVQIADRLGYSGRQTQKALRWLEAEGKVKSLDQGKFRYWQLIDKTPPTARELSNLGTWDDRDDHLKRSNLETFGKDSRA